MTRTGRNAFALALAASGVIVLGGLEIGDNTVGLLWILAASALWALYIVVGSRVAQIGRGVAGLGIGLAIGAVVITPIGAPGSGHVFTTPRLLAGCVLVGVFSNAIGYGIDQHVLRRIPVRRFSVLLALLPVTAVAFGWIGPRSGAVRRRARRHRPRAGRSRPPGTRRAPRTRPGRRPVSRSSRVSRDRPLPTSSRESQRRPLERSP